MNTVCKVQRACYMLQQNSGCGVGKAESDNEMEGMLCNERAMDQMVGPLNVGLVNGSDVG